MIKGSKPFIKELFASNTKPAKHEKWQVLLNALLFQCLWFSIMVFEQIGLILFLGALLTQFFYRRYVTNVSVSLVLPLAVFVLGVSIDIFFTRMGFFSFISQAPTPGIADTRILSIPIWLIVMWLGFILTLQHSLRWLIKRRTLCVLVFAFAGPISYMAGRGFDMINFNDEVSLYLVFSWAMVGWVASLKMTNPSKE